MNLKPQEILSSLKIRAGCLRKAWLIRSETKRRGGAALRISHRTERFRQIKEQKLTIRNSMVQSWGLREIPPPSEEERRRFWLFYHYLPMSYILGVKKKYWNS
jgi:hypothetical protein